MPTAEPERHQVFRIAEPADAPVVGELYRDYIEVLREWNDDVGGELEEAWFAKPEQLYPIVACRPDGAIDGFALVMAREYAQAMGCDGEHYFHALLVREECRGKRLADALVHWIFERYRGRWCLEALTENRRAVEFWRRVVKSHSPEIEVRDDLFTHIHFEVEPGERAGSARTPQGPRS